MTQMIDRMIAGGGNVVSFPIREYWLDVGQPGDYERAQRDMADGSIERMAALLAETRSQGGRLFILGVGGSAANASHAVNDFRKASLWTSR